MPREAEMGNASNDDLMRQAAILLKKRAALKAHCVLVDTKFFQNCAGRSASAYVTGLSVTEFLCQFNLAQIV
jgi:hypothetical protein